jgi:Zn finger protein HypA/HybF involved in hydrogenase expression
MESIVIEIENKWIECGQCWLIYQALHRLHFECPICGFPLKKSNLPADVCADLWKCRPEG